MKNEQVEDSDSDKEVASTHKGAIAGLLRTGLLMASSALLGGIAFSIWNRRQIASLQDQASPKTPNISVPDDDLIY